MGSPGTDGTALPERETDRAERFRSAYFFFFLAAFFFATGSPPPVTGTISGMLVALSQPVKPKILYTGFRTAIDPYIWGRKVSGREFDSHAAGWYGLGKSHST